MENTAVVTSMPTHTSPALVASSRSTLNVCTIYSLGVTQGVIGLLTFSFGIGAIAGLHENYWLTKYGGGILGGSWILLTGIVGARSASKPNSEIWNGANLAFSMASCAVAFIQCCLFTIELGFFHSCIPYNSYYKYRYQDRYCKDSRNAGLGVYGTLITLMIVEFLVAFVTAIYCCKASFKCCSGQVSGGVIIQEQQRQCLMTSSTGQIDTTTSGYPASAGVMKPDS